MTPNCPECGATKLFKDGLRHVAPSEEIRNRLIACMKQITQSRLDEEQASIEARIFDAVLKCESQVEKDNPLAKVSTQAITECFNEGLSEKEQLKSYHVGRRVAALGFEKCRFSGGKSGFFWNKQLIDRLKARYEPVAPPTPPLPKVAPPKKPSLPSHPSHPSLIKEKPIETYQKTSEGSEGQPSEPSRLDPDITVESEGSERSERSEGISGRGPTIREILDKLTPDMRGPFPEDKLLARIMDLGFSQAEAQKRVDHFKIKEIISHDDIGNWYFR